MAVDPSSRAREASYPSAPGEWTFPVTTRTKGMFSCGSSATPAVIYTTPTVASDTILVGTYEGKVMALAPEARSRGLPYPQMRDGEWVYPREEDDAIGPVVGSPVVADGTVYVSSSDGRVYALDAQFGDERWVSDRLGEKLWAEPVVKDSTVYVTTFDGRIYSLSADTGEPSSWVFEAESAFISSPVLHDDIMFLGSAGRRLYAVRLGQQDALWTLEGGDWFWAEPLVYDGKLYASCLDGKLYALEAETGRPLWSKPFDAGERIATSPVLVDGSLVLATQRGNVYLVDAQEGRGKWLGGTEGDDSRTLGGEVLASLCAHGQTAYVLAQNNHLYAVDVARAALSWELPLELE